MNNTLAYLFSIVASHSCTLSPEIGKNESLREVLPSKESLLTVRLPDFADLYSTVQVSDTTKAL